MDAHIILKKLWEEISSLFTRHLSNQIGIPIARIRLTPREIIFNAEHPTLKLYVKDIEIKQLYSMIIQETKRDIIYRRMNLTENQLGREEHNMRIQSHILTTLKKLISYLDYCGPMKNKQCLQQAEQMVETLADAVE